MAASVSAIIAAKYGVPNVAAALVSLLQVIPFQYTVLEEKHISDEV